MKHRECLNEHCTQRVKARGLCAQHLYRLERNGGELPPTRYRLYDGDWDGYCSRCQQHLSLDEFYPSMRRKGGCCRSCNRETPEQTRRYKLAANYNLTPAEYDAILKRQDGGCAICGGTQKLCVDHDHQCCSGRKSCGKCIRGILCICCNNALGLTRDNRTILTKMIDYLDHRGG